MEDFSTAWILEISTNHFEIEGIDWRKVVLHETLKHKKLRFVEKITGNTNIEDFFGLGG